MFHKSTSFVQIFAYTTYRKRTLNPWVAFDTILAMRRETGHKLQGGGGAVTISPLFCTYEAESRFLVDDDDAALELMKRVWDSMLNMGAQTFWEFCHNEEKRWPIPSHAWSAGCT